MFQQLKLAAKMTFHYGLFYQLKRCNNCLKRGYVTVYVLEITWSYIPMNFKPRLFKPFMLFQTKFQNIDCQKCKYLPKNRCTFSSKISPTIHSWQDFNVKVFDKSTKGKTWKLHATILHGMDKSFEILFGFIYLYTFQKIISFS